MNNKPEGYTLAIVGATGAVGTEMLTVLDASTLPIKSLRLFGSERSAGTSIMFRGLALSVEGIREGSFRGVDFALFSAGGNISRQYREQVYREGAILIDNSSAFRMEPGVPLVIPEINPDDLDGHNGVIAVPNCSTIILLMAVAPLRALGEISRIVVSTYQAVSGAGAKAMDELRQQSLAYLNGEEITPRVLPNQIAFNLFSHNTPINEQGYNQEEWKMIQETRKILHADIPITATCIRVPVFRAHSESVNIEFKDERPSIKNIRAALHKAPGVKVCDDREANHFPMPLETAGEYDVSVGRIRLDVSNPRAVDLFISGDQLLKGAALNAVQIVEMLHARRLRSEMVRKMSSANQS